MNTLELSLFDTHPIDTFARALQGNGRNQYKRYIGSPLRYAGGKSLAVGHIVNSIPHKDITRLVSPFCGGGSVEIACANELGIEVIAYDIFDILVNYWHVQLDNPEQLAERIGAWTPDKPTYARVKARLRQHWLREHLIEDRMDLAAHYWFNHNLSYGPGFLGWMSKIYEQPERVARLINKVRTFKCPHLSVQQGAFTNTIPQHMHDFLYCDPPYYLEGDSKMFRGIYPQRNFPVHHKGFDHVALRDILHAHQGGFVLSYNDCAVIRDWYRGYKIVPVRWQYTLGQGETRIGKNRIENNTKHHVKQSHEILIVKETGNL